MSDRFFAEGGRPVDKTSTKRLLQAAVRAGVELLELRQLLNAQVVAPSGPYVPSGTTPLPPLPGVTTYVNAQGASNAWQWSSAITPNTVNDLLLNVTAYAQSYIPCCEGDNAAPGNTGSINAGRLLTNGISQNQIGGFPASGAVAATGSGSNSDASSGQNVVSQNGGNWWLEYNLGTAPGQTASITGYDLNEIDVIAGHQDYRTGMQADVLVQFVGGNATDWFSLSNGSNFSYTGLGRGSAQMAIQSPGGPMASNVRAVKFFAANQQTWYRELVVAGVPSANNVLNVNAPGTPTATADPVPGAIDVVFAPAPGGAQSYAVQRALITSGVPGTFTTIASLHTTANPVTYTDTTGAAGSVYTYRVVAQNSSPAGTFSATSANSNFLATPPTRAEAHYYNMAYWEGPATVAQGAAIVQLNWPSGSPAAGIRNSVNSAVITGKVTPTISGTYTLYSNTDDDGYLYVNGVLVSDDPGIHGQRNAGSAVDINNNPIGFAKPVALTAGTPYNFVLLEHNSGGSAGANLIWKTPTGTLQVVPAANLSPISDTPTAPTNFVMDSVTLNSNFVNFTFTGENNAVVHYILQRALATAPSAWTTVSQIDPGSDTFTTGSNLSTAMPHQFMTIQDAQPLPGTSYIYRASAVNFDGTANSTPISVAVPASGGVNLPGVEIHAYNTELFRRTSLAQAVEASAVAQSGVASEYIAQTTNQTYLGGFYAGPIDRDYTAVFPGTFPQPAPSSPDPTLFPDIARIHTQSFSQAFTGTLTPSVSGIYTIISNTDDDGFAWIDGTLVSADPGVHGQQDTLFPAPPYPGQPSRTQDTLVPVYLAAGQTYDLTMFMGSTEGAAAVHLKWVEPPAFGSTNSGVVLSSSNADQTGATLNVNDPTNTFLSGSYNNYTIFITSGPGSGQAGFISNYNTQTKNFTVNVITNGNQSLWSTLPTSASRFMVAWVAAVPLKGQDNYPVSKVGGLQLRQDLPVQGTWSPADGSVILNTSASAAQNVTITQLSPTAGVSLSWSDLGLSELWYEVQRSTDNASWSTIGTTPMNVGTTFVDPAAANAFNSPTISYFYRVRGVNFDGAGPFSTVVNTNTDVNVSAPQIVNAIEGAPGTAGLVLTGGTVNAGGLDIQYAAVSGGTTGTFIDATPNGLPFATFDYQVTGLTPIQQYVFKVRNLPGGSNLNSSLFGNPVAFTPVGGVQESFGTPGSGVGGFVGIGSTIGDVLVNGNASLTGGGVPAPATPAAPTLSTPVDMQNPIIAIVGATSVADAPGPTNAGTFATSPQNLDLSGASSVFLEYTWVTANGQTLPFSTPASFTIPANMGVLLTYAVPTAPAGFGITNANIYIGTSTQPSSMLLKAIIAPGTSSLITTFPAAGSRSAPTLSSTGMPAGTYFVSYSWANVAGQTTAASPEQTFALTNPSNDLFLPIPSGAPANATNFNLYVGTVSGGERLAASVGSNSATLPLRGIPIFSSVAVPTTNTAGLPVGTYYLQYAWNGSLPNESTTNEGLASPLTSIVVATAGRDVALPVPPSAGTGNANVYFGTLPTNLFFLAQAAPSTTFLARTIPTSGTRPPIPGTVLSGPAALNTVADTVVAPTTPLTIHGTSVDASSTIVTGTYYLKYTWLGNGGETAASAEQNITVDVTGPADLYITVPAGPPGSGNANIYIGTASGAERLLQQAAPNALVILKTLPGTASAAAPAIGTVALPAGTYYLAYTWTSGTGLETAGSAEQTIVVAAAGSDINVVPPTAPPGAANARIYLGTAPGQEFYTGSVAAGSTLAIFTLPNINQKIVPTTNSQNYRLYTPANALQLVNNNPNQQGSAFNLGEDISSFTTSFDFVLTGSGTGSGFGIVFTPEGRTFTGGGGSSLFFANTTPAMDHSAGIFFQTDTTGLFSVTGLGLNGSLPGQSGSGSNWIGLTQNATGSPTGIVLTGINPQDQRVGDVFDVSLSYSPINHVLTEEIYDVTLANRGVNNGFVVRYSIDLVATIGMPSSNVGFVATTGNMQSEIDILNFKFVNTSNTSLNTINGTAGSDQITLMQDPDHLHIDWTMNGGPQIYQAPINSVDGLTINGNGGNDTIVLDYGNGNPLPNHLTLNGTFTVNGLAAAGTPLAGKAIDIGASTVFISYAGPTSDPVSQFRSYLQAGFNGGAWNGAPTATTGVILSTAAASDPNHATGIGYADSADGLVALPANTIELKYTLYGDTGLAGTVSFTDFMRMTQHFTQSTGAIWGRGDFNYDGSVDSADFNLLKPDYGLTLPTPTPVPPPLTAPVVSEPPTSTQKPPKTVTKKRAGAGKLHKSTPTKKPHRN